MAAKEAEHTAALEAKDAEHTAALEAKEAEHATTLAMKTAELPAAFAAKEAEYVDMLKAKDDVFKLKDEEYEACADALVLKNEEVEIMKGQIIGFKGSMLVHQRANETFKTARQELETRLADAEKVKVM